MKILTKVHKASKPLRDGLTEDTNQDTVSYEIPNTTIAGGVTVLSIIATLATSLGNYLGNIPANHLNDKSYRLKEKQFEIQALQRVLENNSSTYRRNSLNILLASEIIEDPGSKLQGLIKEMDTIPKWEHRKLDTIRVTADDIKKRDKPINQNNLTDSLLKSDSDRKKSNPDKGGFTSDQRKDN